MIKMYYPVSTIQNNCNIVNYLHSRESSWNSAKVLQQHFQFTTPLLKRLTLEHQLFGHNGCINCLEWSSNGKLLASGSDDVCVRIWDPFSYKCLNVITTSHVGNIFSVKFLGDESLIATGAGDCRVVVRSIDDTRTSAPHITCKCHRGRVKRLAKAPDQPLLFWSASEDGSVIQYDLREPHECMVKSTIFMRLPDVDLKCIAVNPTKPYLIAIGANDCFARIYDRRMVRTWQYKPSNNSKREPAEPQDSNCVQYYAPAHLARECSEDLTDKLAATYVTFNSSGTELLVNMGGEHIYLFDLNNSRHINELTMPENLLRKNKNWGCGGAHCDIEVNGNFDTTRNSPSNDRTTLEYIEKARSLAERNWGGDLYLAARYFYNVIQQDPGDKKSFKLFIECLTQLKWHVEASSWLNLFQKRFPEDCKILLASSKCAKKKKNENEGGPLTSQELELRANSRDFELRFLGHCNITTDIKEVNYLGENGNYICAGSDDGVIFIWDRRTTEVVTALQADPSIVNCIQPHPSACYLASSGIDPCIRLWSPAKEDGTFNRFIVTDIGVTIEKNQRRRTMSPFETMLMDMAYRQAQEENTSQRIQQMCRSS
ncbi:WD40 domain-containing protein [Oryctes borbonicus]|uniref:WD40 domain-containing protein n=1 Tax=Oryctes borbonicus TaxID=1629725 RepID=A0A0T6B2T2_9SCAR|nr:WD40 domain-containing protein [Oryctes borbonicus]